MAATGPGTTGVYRRRIRLIAAPGTVRAALEDTAHAMRLVLHHDGTRVTDVEPQFTRIPLTTCPGAGHWQTVTPRSLRDTTPADSPLLADFD